MDAGKFINGACCITNLVLDVCVQFITVDSQYNPSFIVVGVPHHATSTLCTVCGCCRKATRQQLVFLI